MKGNATKRLGALLALLVAMQVFALPVANAAVKGTASIAAGQRTVFAGDTTAPFAVTVTNAALASGATPLNHVRIVVPRSTLTPTGYTAPSGWTASQAPGSDSVIFTANGPTDAILPGQNKVFTVNTAVNAVPADTARKWTVAVSDDGGTTSVTQTEASAGALTTVTRVLKVLDAQLIGDPRVTDRTVTSGQTATIRSFVQNAANAPLTVTAEISGLTGSTSTPPAPQVIPAGATAFFDFVTNFGTVGAVTPTVDANATGADGFAATGAAITIQSPVNATYVANSLTPRDVVPGQPYTFTLQVAKTGQVAADINPATTTLSFGSGAFSAPLAAASSFAGGNETKGLTFTETTVPLALLDGLYTPSLSIAGTDSNGFPFTVPVTIGDQIRLDRTLPIVTPILSPPAPKVGTDPATSDGLTLGLGGTITEADGTTTCNACTIQTAELIQYDDLLAEVGRIPVTVTNSNGTLSGSYSGSYAPTATSVRLSVIGKKPNGITGSGLSDLLDVDNIDPFFSSAETGGPSHTDHRRIDITLNEAVTQANGVARADWTVQDNTVESATVTGNVITLTLGSDLKGDEEPLITYAAAPVSSRSQDRVGQNVGNQDIEAVDKILPGTPLIEEVAGKAVQDGKFYTNDSTPSFLISNVSEGQTVTLFEDINNNGVIEGTTDRMLAMDTLGAGATEITLTSADLGTTTRDVRVLGITEDGAGNESAAVSSDILAMDFTLPTPGAVTITGSDVTVGFSEPIVSGRDNTADWTAYGPNAVTGAEQAFVPTEVTGTGASRLLPLDDPDFSGTLTSVSYLLTGPESARYVDRAGNPIANFTTTP